MNPPRPAGNNAIHQAQRLCNDRRHAEAIGVLKRHLKTNRNDSAALGLLGLTYANLGSNGEARKTLKKAMRLNPRSADLRCRYGRVLSKEDLHDQAVAEFRAALAIQPGHTWAVRCLVGALVELQRGDEAYEVAREALDGAPEEPDFLIALQKAAPLVGRHQEGLQAAEALLRHEHLPATLRVQALFDRAGFLAKLGEHERAFEGYLEANRARRVEYDAQRNAAQTDRMIEVWTRERIGSIPVSPRKADHLVFIVGMPRSGTSLVEQIAASHPGVYGAGELPILQRVVSQINGGDPDPISFLADPSVLNKPNIENAAKHYLDKTRAMAPGADRITDKMPDNFRALGLISRLFPGARVVHCTRDSRDTCLSCFSLDFVGKENGFAYDLADLGSFYADYWRLMAHWKSVLDIPILDVSYEAMVSEPEAESRRLIGFLGLEWDDRCLAFHRTRRTTKTLSATQVNKPIYRSSLARWKPYERGLGPLIERLPPATFHT